MPYQAIIDGFKGKIDFYVHDGVPCARKWPRSPGHDRAPAVEAQWPLFTEAVQLWPTLPADIQAAYNKMAEGTGLSGRDLFERAYISGIFI
jgi:hypothetical protein